MFWLRTRVTLAPVPLVQLIVHLSLPAARGIDDVAHHPRVALEVEQLHKPTSISYIRGTAGGMAWHGIPLTASQQGRAFLEVSPCDVQNSRHARRKPCRTRNRNKETVHFPSRKKRKSYPESCRKYKRLRQNETTTKSLSQAMGREVVEVDVALVLSPRLEPASGLFVCHSRRKETHLGGVPRSLSGAQTTRHTKQTLLQLYCF